LNRTGAALVRKVNFAWQWGKSRQTVLPHIALRGGAGHRLKSYLMPLCRSSARVLGLQPIAPLPMRNPSGFEFYPGNRLPALCRDGVTRSAVITGQADTWFSLPAAVQVTVAGKRRTVAGFLSHDMDGKVCFRAYLYRANHALIPLTSHKPRLAKLALRLIKATAYGHGAPGYIWDYAADHAAALAGGCRLFYAVGEWPEGGCAARAVLKRLPPDVLPRLAVYFDKLAALYRLFDPIDQSPVAAPLPPPPPPA
jgi:hypothetical protein